MNIAFIVEARMSSTRLPGKVFLRVNNKPIIKYLIERLKRVKKVKKIILATTKNKVDNVLVDFAKKNKLKHFRGSEERVLERVYFAAKKFKIDAIISITADCPLIDVSIIDQCLKIFLKNKIDFLTNSHFRSYPDGMDVQIFKFQTLKKALKLAKTKKDYEHTTYVMRKNPGKFNTLHIFAPENLNYPKLGLTLDEIEDYKFIKKIIKSFKKNYLFSCQEIINLLKKRKNLLKINSKVKRNSYLLENFKYYK